MEPSSATRTLVAAGSSERELWACYGEPGESATSCAFWDSQGKLIRIENVQQLTGDLRSITPEHVESDAKLNVESKNGRLHLCSNGPEDCRPLPASIQPDPSVTPIVALSPDRRSALLLDAQYTSADVRLRTRVLDYATLKSAPARVSRRPFEGFEDWYGIWPGKFAILSAIRCCGPDGQTLLVDPRTGEWERLHGYRGSVAPLGGSTYLVLDEKQVKFLDVDTGETRPGPMLPGAVPDDVTAVLASTLWPKGPPAAAEANEAFVAVAFPPALIRLKAHSLVSEAPLPLCNSSAIPAEN